jgi:non-ribosomal peptide synthetase component F
MALTNSGSLPYGTRCRGSGNPYPVFEPSKIEQSIAARFEAQAAKRPAAIAIKDADRTLTYGELNALANRVGRVLLAVALANGNAVALLFADAASAIAAMLGVLKAGRFYVTLNPAHTRARLAAIFENSRANVIITNAHNTQLARGLGHETAPIISIDQLGGGELSSDSIPSGTSPDALAYIIYTSGSTGIPKGVVQNHRKLLHNVMKYANAGHIGPADRHALLHSASMPWGLEVDLSQQGQKLLARTSVNTGRHDSAGVAHLLVLYREILAAVAADPRRRLSQLPATKWVGETGALRK